jgi:raffinose/stachyose/melibiose transport system substrate-binding protein
MPAGAGGVKEAADGGGRKLTIRIANNVHLFPEELTKAQGDWYITRALARYTQAHPNVAFDVVFIKGSDTAPAFKAAALAGNAPDINSLWMGNYLFAVKSLVLPLEKHLTGEDYASVSGWDFVRDGFDSGGAVLAYPTGSANYSMFFYNKEIIAKVGLDFEKDPPRTVREFDAALAKIKDAGFIPIASDESQSADFIYHVVNLWWAGQIGIPELSKYNRGGKKFADDTALLAALAYYQSLYANGFLNKDVASSSDHKNKFYQGQVAIIIDGSWSLADMKANMKGNLGAFKIPAIGPGSAVKEPLMGGPGDCIAVSKDSAQPAIALDVIRFLNSKAEVLQWLKVQSVLPIRTDITPEELGVASDPLQSKILGWSRGTILWWPDNVLDSNPMGELAKLSPVLVTGKMNPLQVARQMDEKLADALE